MSGLILTNVLIEKPIQIQVLAQRYVQSKLSP